MTPRTPFTLLALAALTLPAAAQFDPVDAVDINADPNIVEVNLTAAETTWQFLPGIDTDVYAYNGTIPGPTIRTKTGDTLIVNFTNNLPEETTIHWHGIVSYADQDGSHISQRPIQPGESFTYNFKTDDDALFWYHPHVRPYDQVEKGLYGALLVKNPQLEASLGTLGIDEHIVMFDDILLDANDQVVPAFSFTDPLQHALYQLNGREGNHLLINGREATTQNVNVRNGEPVRFRVVNVANTTFCRLDFNDATTGINSDLWLIGQDAGFLETPFLKLPVESTAPGAEGADHPEQALLSEMGQGVLLFPGERDDVVITPQGTPGQVYTVTQNDWFRGRHAAVYNSMGMIMLPDDPLDGAYPTVPAFDITLQGTDPGTGEWVPPANLGSFPVFGDPIGTLPVMYGHSMPDMNGNVILFVQAQMQMINMVMTMVPLPAPKIDSWNAHDVNVGETWDWQIVNLTHGDHNFHSHGFFFELKEYKWEDDLDPDPNLNFNFVPFQRRVKDTVRIPARLGAKGTSRSITTLRAKFDDTNRVGRTAASGMLPTFDTAGNWTSGGWLFHCHILEHSGKGMLSVLEVHEQGELFRNYGKHKAGTNGVYPSLEIAGDLTPGSSVDITALDMLPNKKCWLVVGDYDALRPIAQGTLVPGVTLANASDPLFAPMGAFADANGENTWSITGWDAYPSGTDFWVQVAARDPGALGKLSFSNAVKFTKP